MYRHLLVPALLLSLVLVGCDNGDEHRDRPDPEATDTLPHHDHTDVDASIVIDLTDPDDHPRRDLDDPPADRFDPCHQLLEPDGEPDNLSDDIDDIDHLFFGCDVDDHYLFDDGRRAVAYAIPIPESDDATDLRIVFYDDDGTLLWHRSLDRSHRADAFAPAYRGSFLTPVDNRLICAGTLWLRQTQVICIRQNNGSVVYDGRLDFRAVTDLFVHDGTLTTADDRGITRRYPFSGTEMRHRSFDTRGGASSLYAHDGQRIFYIPGDDEPTLESWDLNDLQLRWRADLTEFPSRSFEQTFADHRLLFVVVDDTLFGIATDDGQLRMAHRIDDERPRMTASDDHLYLLIRPGDHDPVLYALDPDDGTVEWVADAPAGSRELRYRDGELMVRTVRTVRTLQL